MDETFHQSPIKNSTRSKSRKVVVPEPLLLSYSEDEEHRPQPSKRNQASPAPLRAGGHARYFRHSSNQFPIIASKKLADRKGMSKPEFSRGKSKTFQPFNRAFSALYNALQLHSDCAELKRD